MPIKIHHGPPGSYKTAGAMGDDFLREAKAGRVIVTNVRGVSKDRTLEEFPDLPSSFDVIHVDDKTAEGRHKWATWFHWVPHGAFIFLDEVQDLWPKSWKESQIRALDYPGGVDQATKDDRPKDWEQALDKHRHYNWDMTLTTPSYMKVREDVRGIADMAYKHKNLALVGWSGRYIEGAHAADDSGKSASDFINIVNKKVPPYVFKLYDSTQTGAITDTKSGINILKNPRVAVLLGVLLVVGAMVAIRPAPKVLGGSAPSVSTVVGGADKVAVSGGSSPSGSLPSLNDPNRKPPETSFVDPFSDGQPYIVLSLQVERVWRHVVRYLGQDFTTRDFVDMGYKVTSKGRCGLLVEKDDFKRMFICEDHEMNQGVVMNSPRQDLTVPQSLTVTIPSAPA